MNSSRRRRRASRHFGIFTTGRRHFPPAVFAVLVVVLFPRAARTWARARRCRGAWEQRRLARRVHLHAAEVVRLEVEAALRPIRAELDILRGVAEVFDRELVHREADRRDVERLLRELGGGK